jgi:hypothetical protein
VIPDLIPGQLVFVAGPVASGKTYLLQKWAEREPHIVLFDTAGDHVDNPAFEHIWGSPKELADRLSQENRENGNGYKIAYHPTGDIQSGFDWCVTTIWQRDEPRWLILEEIHEFMSPWQQHPKMKMLNKYARKRASLGVIGSTQRLADVHKDFTSAARMSVLFFTQEAGDMNAIRDRWGQEAEQSVKNLRPLVYRDADQVVEQTPQAILIKRGMGHETVDIG